MPVTISSSVYIEPSAIYRSCVVFIALIACEDPFLSSMKSIEYLVDIPIDY